MTISIACSTYEGDDGTPAPPDAATNTDAEVDASPVTADDAGTIDGGGAVDCPFAPSGVRVLFCDGFDDGTLAAWPNAARVGSGGVVRTDTARPFRGPRALTASVPALPAGTDDQVASSIGATIPAGGKSFRVDFELDPEVVSMAGTPADAVYHAQLLTLDLRREGETDDQLLTVEAVRETNRANVRLVLRAATPAGLFQSTDTIDLAPGGYRHVTLFVNLDVGDVAARLFVEPNEANLTLRGVVAPGSNPPSDVPLTLGLSTRSQSPYGDVLQGNVRWAYVLDDVVVSAQP